MKIYYFKIKNKMEKLRKIITNILVFVICAIVCIIFINRYNESQKELNRVEANNRAISERYEDAKNYEYELFLTIDEYKASNDSLINRLRKTQEQLKIKDKELIAAQSINTELAKVDTLILTDTVFIKDLYIDTTLGDNYINNRLVLEYPNSISIGTKVKSEKDVFITQTRETIEEPSRWWICRLFQKKRDVVRVDIIEFNPYITEKKNVFIEYFED